MTDTRLLADLEAESQKPGPTMTITKAQYAWLRDRAVAGLRDIALEAALELTEVWKERALRAEAAVGPRDEDHGHICNVIRERARRLGHPVPTCDCLAEAAAGPRDEGLLREAADYIEAYSIGRPRQQDLVARLRAEAAVGPRETLPMEPDPNAVEVSPGTFLHWGLYLRGAGGMKPMERYPENEKLRL